MGKSVVLGHKAAFSRSDCHVKEANCQATPVNWVQLKVRGITQTQYFHMSCRRRSIVKTAPRRCTPK